MPPKKTAKRKRKSTSSGPSLTKIDRYLKDLSVWIKGLYDGGDTGQPKPPGYP